jgi:hypothetical protein
LAVYFEDSVVDQGLRQEITPFWTPKLDESIYELGLYIHDKFDIFDSDRYKIMPQNSGESYSFLEQRIHYSTRIKGFYATIDNPDYVNYWGNSSTVSYHYKLTDNNGEVLNSNIDEGEYIVITNTSNSSSTIENEYIKIGTESLGYILFKIEDNYLTASLSGSVTPSGRI